MEYENALKTSLETCWSFVYYKYPILPSIVSFGFGENGIVFSSYPFQLSKDRDDRVCVSYIGEELIDLCDTGSMVDDRHTIFDLPQCFASMCSVYEPTLCASVTRGWKQRTKDAINLYYELEKVSREFICKAASVSKLRAFDLRISIMGIVDQLHEKNKYDLSESAGERRMLFGMSPEEYVLVLTKLNDFYKEKLYDLLHLSDPEGIAYLFRDIDGFCKEYSISAQYREILSLYIRLFKPMYEKIYVHLMHYGNMRFLRWSDDKGNVSRAIKDLQENPNKKSAKIAMMVERNDGKKEFVGSGAIEMNQGPCSLGMSSIYIMTTKGLNDDGKL